MLRASYHSLNMRQVQPETLQKNSNFFPVYKISSLKITLPKIPQLKTLDFLQQTITMNENAQWQMIKNSVLFALSSVFSFLFGKKSTCSVFLLFSRCIDHFICYSRIVYIGDSLGHVI